MTTSLTDLNTLPDELLIAEIQDGSLLAFQVLVRRYESRLFFYVRRIVRDESTAEEVVQDTFLKVYQSVGRIDLELRFTTYLFTIAKHTAISALRRHRPEVQIDEALSEPSPDDLTTAVDHSMLSGVVARALAQLDEKYRQVIELYYFQQLTYEEVQARTGLPLNTVRTNLHRAKKLLRQLLSHER